MNNAQPAPQAGLPLDSEIDTASADFKANREAMSGLLKEWRARLAKVKLGGGADAIEKHKARGKLTAR